MEDAASWHVTRQSRPVEHALRLVRSDAPQWPVDEGQLELESGPVLALSGVVVGACLASVVGSAQGYL